MFGVEEQLEELRNFKVWALESMVQTYKSISAVQKKICTLESFQETATKSMGVDMQSPHDKRRATIPRRTPSEQVGNQPPLVGNHSLPITSYMSVGNGSTRAENEVPSVPIWDDSSSQNSTKSPAPTTQERKVTSLKHTMTKDTEQGMKSFDRDEVSACDRNNVRTGTTEDFNKLKFTEPETQSPPPYDSPHDSSQ